MPEQFETNLRILHCCWKWRSLAHPETPSLRASTTSKHQREQPSCSPKHIFTSINYTMLNWLLYALLDSSIRITKRSLRSNSNPVVTKAMIIESAQTGSSSQELTLDEPPCAATWIAVRAPSDQPITVNGVSWRSWKAIHEESSPPTFLGNEPPSA